MLTAVLGMMAAVFFFIDKGDTRVMFRVEDASGTQQIALYDGGEGEHFLFLPSYAELETVCLSSNLKNGIVIGETAMTAGASCAGFALDEPYALTINGREAGTIRFCRSANVATMFIDTVSGIMDHIHVNKDHEEHASIAVYGADGICSAVDANCTIKGRGNYTWTVDKRPYSLTLSVEDGIVGMNPATNWVLLANATDETNLRNKLVFDLASKIGFEWVPDCEYVDVYLNGEFNGLYLLAEKVEIGTKRLNIDSDGGDFLCRIDLDERLDILRNPFVTRSGRTVELTAPEIQTIEERNEIIALVDQMEQTILSGEGIFDAQSMDWNSWVRRYLIDEISGNIDSDLASSYFYYSDGVFRAGPVWDYDMSLGNSVRNRDPESYIAANIHKSANNTSEYYGALLSNASFRESVAETYEADVRPVLQQMVSGGISSLAMHLESASKLNRIRWKEMFGLLHNTAVIATATDDIISYLDRRISFLDRAWLEGVEYCTLQFEHTQGNYYENISVKKGDVFVSDHIDTVDTVWVVKDSGEVYDFSQPVMEDVILVKYSELQQAEEVPEMLATRDYITIASIAAVVFLMLCFGAVDLMRRRKERRGTNAGTHVPS